MLDERRWQRLWKRLNCRSDSALPFAQLLRAYDDPHRAYHNAAHIEDCLEQLDRAAVRAQKPEEVEAALWFHDAICDPRESDNEERSAAWAAQVLDEAGAAPVVSQRIAALIRATKHDSSPDTNDCSLLMDVDLSILGREPEVFAAHDRAIREEYRWVGETEYRSGRAQILEQFLRRPKIYWTEDFRSRLEAQARENLMRAIAQLRG
jgi:predicted metal-dependent HD superfamily phosphohydrolase